MRKINKYAVDLLSRMLEIYSPSGEEEVLSDLLLQEMKTQGFHSFKDEIGNVIGEAGSGGPTILLCGHMDTVPGQLPFRVEGDKLYGRGAVDAKASLAAMIVAASYFVTEELPGKLLVIGVVDEEGLSKGTKHLIQKKLKIDYAIFGEPSGVENITIAYKGSLHLKLICRTKTGHSSAPWLFENAVEKAFELWRMIYRHRMPQEKLDSHFYSLTSCLTRIEGGDYSSSIPSRCEIHIDIRIPPQLTTKQVFKEIEGIVEQYRVDRPTVSVDAFIEDFNEAYEADKRSILVRALSLAIKEIKSKPAVLLRKTGTGDMNILGNAMKIPVITYGPGNSSLDHSLDEHIEIQEYLDSIEVLRSTLKRLVDLEAQK